MQEAVNVNRDQLEMMEENLIQQVQEMAGVDIDEIDDEEYERLQAVILESMTAQEDFDTGRATAVDDGDDDLPVGMAGHIVGGAANMANQFTDWASMRVAATENTEEDKKED